MLEKLYENVLHLLGIESKEPKVPRKNWCSSKKFVTEPIELHNNNVVYPDNRTEREIEKLYEEIREMQANSSITRNKYRGYHRYH